MTGPEDVSLLPLVVAVVVGVEACMRKRSFRVGGWYTESTSLEILVLGDSLSCLRAEQAREERAGHRAGKECIARAMPVDKATAGDHIMACRTQRALGMQGHSWACKGTTSFSQHTS